MIKDYRVANDQVKKIPWPHLRFEGKQGFLQRDNVLGDD